MRQTLGKLVFHFLNLDDKKSDADEKFARKYLKAIEIIPTLKIYISFTETESLGRDV